MQVTIRFHYEYTYILVNTVHGQDRREVQSSHMVEVLAYACVPRGWEGGGGGFDPPHLKTAGQLLPAPHVICACGVAGKKTAVVMCFYHIQPSRTNKEQCVCVCMCVCVCVSKYETETTRMSSTCTHQTCHTRNKH